MINFLTNLSFLKKLLLASIVVFLGSSIYAVIIASIIESKPVAVVERKDQLTKTTKTLWTSVAANIRECGSMVCHIIGVSPAGTKFDLTNYNLTQEWLEIIFSDVDGKTTKKGYMHKSVLSETPIVSTSPSLISTTKVTALPPTPPPVSVQPSPSSIQFPYQQQYIPPLVTDTELTVKEIKQISKSIVQIECLFGNLGSSSGSGHYTESGVLTNAHVIIDELLITLSGVSPKCLIFFPDLNTGFSAAAFEADINNPNSRSSMDLQNGVDFSIVQLGTQIAGSRVNLAERISLINICEGDILTGTKVYVFGYPASAEGGGLIVTEGIISGKKGMLFFDKSGTLQTAYDYYTSAKIDQGNSGGLAVTKINGILCAVGMPTWLSRGSYENLGIIQSFGRLRSAVGR